MHHNRMVNPIGQTESTTTNERNYKHMNQRKRSHQHSHRHHPRPSPYRLNKMALSIIMLNTCYNLNNIAVRGFAPLYRTRHGTVRMLATDSRSLQRRDEYLRENGMNKQRGGLGTNNGSNGISGGGGLGGFRFAQLVMGGSGGLPLLSQRVISGGAGFSSSDVNITLTAEERALFDLLLQSAKFKECGTTLRVAGGWVRDKLLQSESFSVSRKGLWEPTHLSKHPSKGSSSGAVEPSKGRKGSTIVFSSQHSHPLDIDIALDDMLGREFADLLNEYLLEQGKETVSVGTILKNPEKSKHLETATMKVGQFWVDFVNLRAEEYAGDSRIPELMRIGTAEEDALRRDLTINALFYNINDGIIEDLTGRGLDHLRRGVISTPLPALTTLLDDPLRILRSIRFAARLRFSMADELRMAARDEKVKLALARKVSRERVGGEVDLMFRTRDPVGAMRLILNLNLTDVVFPVIDEDTSAFDEGLTLLTTTHDYLQNCHINPPIWCQKKEKKTEKSSTATDTIMDTILVEDEEKRRLLWYAAFLKPLHDRTHTESKEKDKPRRRGKKAHQSIIMHLMLDQLKRPTRDAESTERLMRGANDFTRLLQNPAIYHAAKNVLLHEIKIERNGKCTMAAEKGTISIDTEMVVDPLWTQTMGYRAVCARVMEKVGDLWRPALILALSEQLATLNDGGDFDVAIEGDVVAQSHEEIRRGVIEQHDAFAASIVQLGLVGIENQKPLVDGKEMKMDHCLPRIPKGPVFKNIMDEQVKWMRTHPNGGKRALIRYLRGVYPQFCTQDD